MPQEVQGTFACASRSSRVVRWTHVLDLSTTQTITRRLQLVDVMNAPLSERPGQLLRLLGDALTRARRLPAASGLTAHALVRRADLADDERAELAQVAAAAEAVRYAPEPPAAERLEKAVDLARSLLARLARARAPRGS